MSREARWFLGSVTLLFCVPPGDANLPLGFTFIGLPTGWFAATARFLNVGRGAALAAAFTPDRVAEGSPEK
jgi:hypothetical protein